MVIVFLYLDTFIYIKLNNIFCYIKIIYIIKYNNKFKMSENIQTLETAINNIDIPITKEPKQLKTKSYVLNASKRYRDKHPEKMKEYREKYKKEMADVVIKSLPNENLTKFQLIIKITRLEDNIKTLELKNKELEDKINKK